MRVPKLFRHGFLSIMAKEINTAFLRIARRAEANERAKLLQTFVDVGPLFTLLGSPDHQVLYGRRGTGKTHALLYLAETQVAAGHAVIYLDMRTVGSTGGIYSDPLIPVAERATRLLMDTLTAVHAGLLDFAIGSAERTNLAIVGPLLDRLASAITEVVVVGAVSRESSEASRATQVHKERAEAGIAGTSARYSAVSVDTDSLEQNAGRKVVESGMARHRVHFGDVGAVLIEIAKAFAPSKIWVLLDEWSVVPLELQPLLADLLRRSLFPVRGVVVKIAAIEQRTHFRIPADRGEYVGLELGADVAADLNLDDFMVFENDASRATEFFQELLFRHYKSAAEELGVSQVQQTSAEMVRLAFTQRNTFEEFVRAAEGVPRDAINILGLAAQRAFASPISTEHVRSAAKTWYQRDKEAAVSANTSARDFLHWIIEEVIAHRRARAFLFRSGARHELVDALFDARVLHLLKRNIAAHDQPGVRFDVYKIDYGCYVDLLTTVRAPQGLLPSGEKDESQFVDVPPDDYRAIRRAILDVERFRPSGLRH